MLPESPISGRGVVRYEAVEHDDVAGDAPTEVQGRHHCGQPDPLAPLVQVDGVDEVCQGRESPTEHVEGEEREPAKLVTPAPEVEGEEDGNEIVGDGDDVVKAHHLEVIRGHHTTNSCQIFTSCSTAVYSVVFVCSSMWEQNSAVRLNFSSNKMDS